MKIAIIVRNETLDKCTGHGCLKAFSTRSDAFADYDENAELVSFTQDSGDLDRKIATLRKNGVEVVHLSSCIRAKREDYAELAEKLSLYFHVVGYTHGSFEGRTRKAICLNRSEKLAK